MSNGLFGLAKWAGLPLPNTGGFDVAVVSEPFLTLVPAASKRAIARELNDSGMQVYYVIGMTLAPSNNECLHAPQDNIALYLCQTTYQNRAPRFGPRASYFIWAT